MTKYIPKYNFNDYMTAEEQQLISKLLAIILDMKDILADLKDEQGWKLEGPLFDMGQLTTKAMMALLDYRKYQSQARYENDEPVDQRKD